MTKLKRLEDGGYLIGGKKYESLKGTRRQVFDYETAYKTAGGLHKEDLVKNDKGRIVSKAKYDKGPELLKNLTKRGFYTKKGKFGHKKMKANKTRKNKKYGGDGEEASEALLLKLPLLKLLLLKLPLLKLLLLLLLKLLLLKLLLLKLCC